MHVASVDCAFPRRVMAYTSLAGMLALAAGVAGAAAPLVALAVAIGGATLVPAVALMIRGLAIHIEFRAVPSVRAACQCAGLVGVGLLAVGLTAAALPLVEPEGRDLLVTASLAVVATLFASGLLQVPGVAATAVARVRHVLDGILVGLCLATVGWLILPPVTDHHRLGYAAAVLTATSVSITVATVLRTMRQRPATIRTGTGMTLVVLGMALLAVSLRPDLVWWAPLLAVVPVLAGGPLLWAGARRVELRPTPAEPASPDEIFGGYPMLGLLVAMVVLAVGYRMATHGLLDRIGVLFGMGIGGIMAVREVISAHDLRQYARRSATHQARLRALVAGASDVTMTLGDDLVVRWRSPAAAHQLGLRDEDVVGQPLTARIHPEDTASFIDRLQAVIDAGQEVPSTEPALVEARLLDGHGRWRETESTISDLRAVPEVGALVVQIRDVGQRRRLERTLHRLTSTDERTGLANRRELLRAINIRRGAGMHAGALLVIDLYGMTAVNDLRGGRTGDAVLAEVVRRLRERAGPDDLLSRLGDSQFAVVTAEQPIEAYALGVALLAALTEPYQLPDRPVRLQASVGLTGLAAGDSPDDVVRRGTLALRQASQLGRNRIEWFDASLEEHLIRRLDLERHLPGAAGRGELDLVYQPVVELANEQPVGVEALLRWRHPALGTVLPGELMPVADRLRVSEEIGEWVLHSACQQAAAWRRDGHDLWLSVNVTIRQLTGDFVPEVAAALSVHQIPPERLTVEISDVEIGERTRVSRIPDSIADDAEPISAPARDRPAPVPTDRVDDLPAIATHLSKLRALGVRTALDDFGAGNTELARLRRLPLDVVKLAPSSAAEPAGGMATAVVELARRLGLMVVAEQLETAEQLAVVRDAGCRFGQGFLLSRPAPPERVEAYLVTQASCGRS